MPSRKSCQVNLSAAPAKKLKHAIARRHCIMSTIVGGWPVSAASRNFKLVCALLHELDGGGEDGGALLRRREGHGPSSNASRAAAHAASTSAAAASGTLPTNSPVAGECTSMTSDVAGSTHLPPMNSLSHSVS